MELFVPFKRDFVLFLITWQVIIVNQFLKNTTIFILITRVSLNFCDVLMEKESITYLITNIFTVIYTYIGNSVMLNVTMLDSLCSKLYN